MHLTKHHGFGNDFLVALLDEMPSGAPELARRLCHRRRGIGADGLVIGLVGLAAAGADADVAFTLFNSDGSSAEVSGNGLRCLAQAVARRALADGRPAPTHLTAATPAGVRSLDFVGEPDADEVLVAVDMGAVSAGGALDDEQLATALALAGPVVRWSSADIGNPHIVVQVGDPASVDLAGVGRAVESVTGPINVHFVAPVDGNVVRMAIWERGAGITEACGSGACVVAHVARAWRLVDGPTVGVEMPGGRAEVRLDGDRATLIGPAVFIADIEVRL